MENISIYRNKTIQKLIICFGILFSILLGRIIYLENAPIVQIKKEYVYYPVLFERITEVEVEKTVCVEVINTIYIKNGKLVGNFTQAMIENKILNITAEERDLLARALYLEAGAQSIECQKKVASAIINYWLGFNGKKTLKQVIYSGNYLSVADSITKTVPKQTQYDVIDYLIENGSVLPEYVKYFRNQYHHNWKNYVGYCDIENIYFGYLLRDVK